MDAWGLILSLFNLVVTVCQNGIPKTLKYPNSTAHCFEKQTSVFLQQFQLALLMVFLWIIYSAMPVVEENTRRETSCTSSLVLDYYSK
jgi:hypothetical protein